MKLDATPDTIRSVAETLKLAAILDDRVAHADQARIAAWSEQVQRHALSREDLLDGLQRFYDEPHATAIGIGDLIARGKIAKRDRVDREAESDRELRRLDQDGKVADAPISLPGMVFGPARGSTPRLDAAREGLQTCFGRAESLDALTEYFDAKREANRVGAR